ncbi:MAG TPA: DinB family protein [Bryobacteraceae bacterium]|nr:DinB family protein [Bryobacteraceae bacterium]
MDSSDRMFLDFSARKLRQLSGRIEDCLSRLTEEEIWARGAETENAVGNLVLHLSGNVRQWIVAGVGGQPDIRQRDAEFAARGGLARPGLAEHLRGTVDEAVAVIEALTPERLAEHLTVQSYDETVLEAIYHVVEHFSGHAGQIIYATKLLTGEDLGYYKHLKTTAPHAEQTP